MAKIFEEDVRARAARVVAVPARNLDTLRALAVLAVLINHISLAVNRGERELWGTNSWTLGRAGVLCFFVHTSLVLMLSMERMGYLNGSLVWRFYVRRLFRIYPLSITACVALSILAIPRDILGQTPFVWNWRIFAGNVLLIQNLTGDPLISYPMWSLPCEVQMYLALPFIFLALKSRRRWWVFAGLLFAGALAGWRFRLLEFVPCFLAGIAAYLLLERRRARLPWWGWPLVVTAAVAAFCAYDPARMTPRKSWTLCLALGLLVPCFKDCASRPVAWLANRIARYSYGLYLSHYPLLWLCFEKGAPLGWLTRSVIFSIAVVAVPVLVYHAIEHPLQQLGIRISESRSASRAAARA